tara:strand:+ start:190000 stop:190599 length:600 start_codon:yes stop_codon:yes gene_type:complete
MVENWKSPDVVLFGPEKVLLVGMTGNEEVRTHFETALLREFFLRGTEAMRSLDLFDVEFINSERSEEEIAAVERLLLSRDFDAVLLTKITGYENQMSPQIKRREVERKYDRFRDNYGEHQYLYYQSGPSEADAGQYMIETAIYCIRTGKTQQLIWKETVRVTDTKDLERVVEQYISQLLRAMEQQQVIKNLIENENTDL